jgi:branched-chain amino acid aminotransferase
MPPLKKVEKIWVDGKLAAWDDATDHVLAHTLHYGVGAFEGIRAYHRRDGRTSLFRLREHIDRLFDSCHIATMEIPFARQQLADACVEVVKVNKLTAAYVRPLVYLGYGALGLGTLDAPVRTVVAAFEWGAYLGDDGLRRGIRCKVSSYRRSGVDSIMSKGKICGQYVTSVLAKRDAIRSGCDEAIMLDDRGLVCEGSGENIFLVKGGVIRTPPTSAPILNGITRDAVMTLARELGHDLREQSFTRDEMWTADEIFLTGTAAEITPVREVDGRKIGAGEPGPVTRRLQERFFQAARDAVDVHPEWSTFV